MKQEEQRIAIAEACGIEKISQDWWGWRFDGIEMPGDMPIMVKVPDYLNDLNAMHEAEKSLTPAQFRDYRKRLNWRKDYGVTAEASERAEDFLKAINKWTDDT